MIIQRKLAEYRLLVTIYHNDPKANLEHFERLDPDYIGSNDMDGAEGLKILKEAMAGGGMQVK